MREDLQKWLLGLDTIAAACQIVFHVGNVALQGCAYIHTDLLAEPRFYLLGGTRSFNKRISADKYVFEWDQQKKFPLFNREIPKPFEWSNLIHSHDWLVYCYWNRGSTLSQAFGPSEQSDLQPFGPNMVIGEWHHADKIDAPPQLHKHYRIKMSVDFETKFITPKGRIYRV